MLTIRDMSLLVNLSRKVASSGNFAGFCIRFSNQFSLRHKTWTMDSRKNKITNCGRLLATHLLAQQLQELPPPHYRYSGPGYVSAVCGHTKEILRH